eukprot:IDg12130t1
MSLTTSLLRHARCQCVCFQGLAGALPSRTSLRVTLRRICTVRAGIATSVDNSLKDAMRARDSNRVRALRGIRAAFMVAMKEDGSDDLDDSKAIAQLRRLEKDELAIIENYLPALADEAQTRMWAEEAKNATGATSKKEFGKVMGAVMKSHREEVDGALLKKHCADASSSISVDNYAKAASAVAVATAGVLLAATIKTTLPVEASVFNFGGERPTTIGLRSERYLSSCPTTPNCISSMDNVYDAHYVPAWTYATGEGPK